MAIFENDSSFDLISLRELAGSFLGFSGERIGLPGFQRHAAWKEEKVEALWDSLICRFPIGSILLARYGDFSEVGFRTGQLTRSGPYPDTLVSQDGVNFIVVDGQQRLNAISIGFMPFQPEAKARLWLDLAGPKDPGRGLFDFYLCTSENPFGSGLSKDDKWKALELIQKEGLDDSELSLADTYPYKARVPVPFFEFCQLIRTGADLETIRNKILTDSSFLQLNEGAFRQIKKKLDEKLPASQMSFDQVKAVKEVVLEGDYELPVILVERRGHWMTPERLGKLFERVNINGEVPPQGELFLSALKLRSPQVNNDLAEIINDDQLGGLMAPTEIVLAALRLIEPRFTGLQLSQFERISRDYHTKLLDLMEGQNGTPSRFYRIFRLVYEALHFQREQADFGLPRQLLLRLRPRVWHTLMTWVQTNLQEIEELGAVGPQDRFQMVRFALLDALNFFASGPLDIKRRLEAPALSTLMVEAAAASGQFSTTEIFGQIKKRLAEQKIDLDIPSPQAYLARIRPAENPDLPVEYSLSNEPCLLLYAQRRILTNWESYHLELDYLIPALWMNFRAGRTPVSYFWRVGDIVDDRRYLVLNSIGNKRFWPELLTRAYGDHSPRQKFISKPVTAPTDHWHARSGLNKVQDVLDASFIGEDQVDGWEAVSRNQMRIWTKERFSHFKWAVDERRCQMYTHLYEQLRLRDLA